MTILPTFKFANPSELQFGISMDELLAAEGLAIYISKNRHTESFYKTEAEFASILGLDLSKESDQDCVNYAVNVCKRLFPHQVAYKA